MKWKQWKLGAIIAVILSCFVAGTGLATGITWQQFVAILCAALVTHFGAYIKDHPVDKIEFDTTTIAKSSTTTNQETGKVTTESSVEKTTTPVDQTKP